MPNIIFHIWHRAIITDALVGWVFLETFTRGYNSNVWGNMSRKWWLRNM